MSVNFDDEIQQIKDQANGKRVFLVEGVNDEILWKHWFSLKNRTYDTQWHIAVAGKKDHVMKMKMLQQETAWFGIVDKDEWLPEKIAEQQRLLPNLQVLPRYCIENYLIVPDELWHSLPNVQRNKISQTDFSDSLLNNLGIYVKHGVWWYVINPLWKALRDKGFNLDLRNIENLQQANYIRQKLEEWHNTLNPDEIEAQFDDLWTEVQQQSLEIQLKQYVHGKVFFEKVVAPQFVQHFGQMRQNKIRENIQTNLALPDDILPIFKEIGL